MAEKTVYEIITDRIIGQLTLGTVPWQKPWQSAFHAPKNLVSKKAYSGINSFLLHAMSFTSPYWLTYKQAESLGGNVKKTPIVFWKWLDGAIDKETGKVGKVPLLRYFSAFNVEQCDGITAPVIETVTREHTPIESAELILAAMPNKPGIRNDSTQASYSPALDLVRMPKPETFIDGENYYSVLFHELTHSTGHTCRLNRKDFANGDGHTLKKSLWPRWGQHSCAVKLVLLTVVTG